MPFHCTGSQRSQNYCLESSANRREWAWMGRSAMPPIFLPHFHENTVPGVWSGGRIYKENGSMSTMPTACSMTVYQDQMQELVALSVNYFFCVLISWRAIILFRSIASDRVNMRNFSKEKTIRIFSTAGKLPVCLVGIFMSSYWNVMC